MPITDRAPGTAAGADIRSSATDTGLLLLRVGLGIIFLAHGAQKVFGLFGGHGLAATVGGMESMGIPAPLAYLASFTELFGGLAVLLGILTRLASLGLLITMLVAILLVGIKGGFFAPKGFEFAFSLAVIALTLMFTGPGRFAVGDWERRAFRRGSAS